MGNSQIMRWFYFVTMLENIGQLAKCVRVRCFAPGVPRKYRLANGHTGAQLSVSSEGRTNLPCDGGSREKMLILIKARILNLGKYLLKTSSKPAE